MTQLNDLLAGWFRNNPEQKKQLQEGLAMALYTTWKGASPWNAEELRPFLPEEIQRDLKQLEDARDGVENQNAGDLVTVGYAAKLLGVDRGSVHNYIKQGRMSGIVRILTGDSKSQYALRLFDWCPQHPTLGVHVCLGAKRAEQDGLAEPDGQIRWGLETIRSTADLGDRELRHVDDVSCDHLAYVLGMFERALAGRNPTSENKTSEDPKPEVQQSINRYGYAVDTLNRISQMKRCMDTQ